MTTTDEIRRLLEAKADALVAMDVDALDSLIHPEFIYVNAAGQTFDKPGYIETYCTSGRVVFMQQRVADLSVKLIDDFAVATLAIHDELRIGDRRITGHYRALCVFAHAAGRWQWAAGQTMAIGAS